MTNASIRNRQRSAPRVAAAAAAVLVAALFISRSKEPTYELTGTFRATAAGATILWQGGEPHYPHYNSPPDVRSGSQTRSVKAILGERLTVKVMPKQSSGPTGQTGIMGAYLECIISKGGQIIVRLPQRYEAPLVCTYVVGDVIPGA